MKVLVTGATGFVGKHVLAALLDVGGCEVTACGRRASALTNLGCAAVTCDLTQEDPGWFERLGQPDLVIHLAWERFSGYRDQRHIEIALPAHYRFLRTLLKSGLPRLVCVGTCFEYGLQQGRLAENLPARPVLPYAVAKDALRRFLDCLGGDSSFQFTWLRLFYMFGPGQHTGSLIPQVDRALDSGAGFFAMSKGEQLRDYQPVESAARQIVEAALQEQIDGVINICRGAPISVRGLVEDRIRERGRQLTLKLGEHPYPNYEPLAFWGDDRRLRLARAAFAEQQPRRRRPASGSPHCGRIPAIDSATAAADPA